MEATPRLRSLTYPEYETLEQQSENRYEFDAGQVYAMAGGTLNHNELVSNTTLVLRSQMKDRGCKAYTENVKVELFSRIEETSDLQNLWVSSIYESLDDVIVLPRLNAELSLKAIYDDVELIPEEENLSD